MLAMLKAMLAMLKAMRAMLKAMLAMLKAMLKLALLWGTLGMLGEPKAGGNPKGNYEEEARVP